MGTEDRLEEARKHLHAMEGRDPYVEASDEDPGEEFMEAVEVSEAEVRKGRPVCTGVLDYFPDAILAVAEASRIGNEQHNPGSPLHWDRSKSGDEADALVRHLMDRGSVDSGGVRHSAKVAWRALALLQKEIEDERTD